MGAATWEALRVLTCATPADGSNQRRLPDEPAVCFQLALTLVHVAKWGQPTLALDAELRVLLGAALRSLSQVHCVHWKACRSLLMRLPVVCRNRGISSSAAAGRVLGSCMLLPCHVCSHAML